MLSSGRWERIPVLLPVLQHSWQHSPIPAAFTPQVCSLAAQGVRTAPQRSLGLLLAENGTALLYLPPYHERSSYKRNRKLLWTMSFHVPQDSSWLFPHWHSDRDWNTYTRIMLRCSWISSWLSQQLIPSTPQTLCFHRITALRANTAARSHEIITNIMGCCSAIWAGYEESSLIPWSWQLCLTLPSTYCCSVKGNMLSLWMCSTERLKSPHWQCKIAWMQLETLASFILQGNHLWKHPCPS